MMSTRRPTPQEYPERYERYVALVPEHDIAGALIDQLQRTEAWLRSIPSQQMHHRYAPDKWTLGEVVGHVLDTERLFGFRLLSIARGDPTPHAVADEELWMRHSEFDRYFFEALKDEFVMVRQSHVSMLRHLPVAAWDRCGPVGGTNVSVRALGYTMLGHERHHWNIVRTRYLSLGDA
jgi:hypothetical protein